MKKITLECGLSLEIDERILNDMELVDDMAQADDGDPTGLSRLVLRLLGSDQRKALYKQLRTDGIVPTDKVLEAVKEIFEKLGEAGKNS